MDNILITIFRLFFQGLFDCLIHLTSLYKLDQHVSHLNNRKTERKEREIQATQDSLKKKIRLYFNRHKVVKCLIWCVSLSILIYGSISVFYSYLVPFIKLVMTFFLSKLPVVNQIFIENPGEKLGDTETTDQFDDLWLRIEKVLSTIFNSL